MSSSLQSTRPGPIPDSFKKRWERGNLEEAYVSAILVAEGFYVLMKPRHIVGPGEDPDIYAGQKDLLLGLRDGVLPHLPLQVKSSDKDMTWHPDSLPWDPYSICRPRELDLTVAYAIVSQTTGAILGHLPGRGERRIGQQLDRDRSGIYPRIQIRRKDCVTFEELVDWLKQEAASEW